MNESDAATSIPSLMQSAFPRWMSDSSGTMSPEQGDILMPNAPSAFQTPCLVSSGTLVSEGQPFYFVNDLFSEQGLVQPRTKRRMVSLGTEDPMPFITIHVRGEDLYKVSEDYSLWSRDLAFSSPDYLFVHTDSSGVFQSIGDSIPTHKTRHAVMALIEAADYEDFEDGMQSNFARDFGILVMKRGTEALKVFRELGAARTVNAVILAEGLRMAGRLQDPQTREYRFSLLVSFLEHWSPLVRDAASLALADMNDVRAVPFLREAIERESSPSLKEDLKQLVDDLGV